MVFVLTMRHDKWTDFVIQFCCLILNLERFYFQDMSFFMNLNSLLRKLLTTLIQALLSLNHYPLLWVLKILKQEHLPLLFPYLCCDFEWPLNYLFLLIQSDTQPFGIGSSMIIDLFNQPYMAPNVLWISSDNVNQCLFMPGLILLME